MSPLDVKLHVQLLGNIWRMLLARVLKSHSAVTKVFGFLGVGVWVDVGWEAVHAASVRNDS